MEVLREYILLILPLALLQLGLQVWALVDLARRPAVKGGNKTLWAVLVVFGGILGALIYLALGAGESGSGEDGAGGR